MAFWERVRKYFQQPLGTDPQPEGGLVQLLQPLDLLRHQALNEALKDREQSQHQEKVADHRQVLETQARMRQEILELHAKLRTGLGEAELESISANLKAHCKAFRAPRPDELNELAMLAVMARFHLEALRWAWEDFQRRLDEAGLSWPDPTGMAPHADPDEVEQHRRLHFKELNEGFLRGPFIRFADLILGAVPVWGKLYPDPQGAVWRETIFEAVAAALACRRLSHLEAVAEREHAFLEECITRALASELGPLQRRLAAGVSSVAEARNLSDQAVAVCQRVAPEVVWNALQAHL